MVDHPVPKRCRADATALGLADGETGILPRSVATLPDLLLDAALDLQDLLCEAQTSTGTHRQHLLQRSDAALNRLRLYLRLAHHWQWLSDGQYQHVSRMVAEIGRLLGGWIKTTRRGAAH